MGKSLIAEFFLANGWFSGFFFEPSPKAIRDVKDVRIDAVEVRHDPMIEGSQPELRRVCIEDVQLPEWVATFRTKYVISDVKEPLDSDAMKFFLSTAHSK